MKTTVIHHSADYDGIFCREIAKKFLPDAELIGWDFADASLTIPHGLIYVLDLPVDRVFGYKYKPEDTTGKGPKQGGGGGLIWIDHHKSSIETHPVEIPGYRIDGVAACRLAWQWFTFERSPHVNPKPSEWCLPLKPHFMERTVTEPFAVRLAGEYDIWDRRDDRAEMFQHGLRSQELTSADWTALLDPQGTIGFSSIVQKLLMQAKPLIYAKNHENESIIKELGFTFTWEGMIFLACNAARYNSHLFTAGLKPEHDACFGFKWTGNDWSVSLYHAPGKENYDLSLIAVKHGGGGHRGACGFRANTLPFLPLNPPE